jgi:preprotein translocase subunit SecD
MKRYLIISIIFFSVACASKNTLTKHEFADISDHTSGIFLFEENGKVYPHFADEKITYTLAANPSVPFSDFDKISKSENGAGAYIVFKLSADGAVKFEKLTTQYHLQKIAFVIDGLVISTPVIHMPVSGGAVQISGLSKEEADFIFRKVKASK